MTDTMGKFVWGGKMYLSPAQIQKMKKNMKKVPVIHEKGERYHVHEAQEAEKFITEQLLSNKK